jgi:hypothetical protein
VLRHCLSAALLLLTLVARAPAQPVAPAAAKPVVLYDFEADEQVRAFATSDSLREGGATTELVYAFRSALAPERVGGQHSLYIVFHEAEDAWAKVTAPVKGAEWAAAKAATLAFWANPCSADSTVEFSLETDDGTSFVHEVALSGDGWQEIALPIASFKAQDGRTADAALESITRLGIAKRGTWPPSAFRLDQFELRAEGAPPAGTGPEPPTGVGPEGPGTPVEGPTTPIEVGPTTPPVQESYAVNVAATFASPTSLYFRPYLGGNVLQSDLSLLAKPEVALAAKALEPMTRTIATVPPDPSDDAATLAELSVRIAALSKVSKERGILVCVQAPADGSVTAERYAGFCETLVRRFGATAGTEQKQIRYWELFDSPVLIGDADYQRICQMANSAAKRIRAADADARIGGMAFFAAQRGIMDRVLRGTKGAFTFLSWHFYGASMASVADDMLFQAADSGLTYGKNDPIGPDQVLELLKVADLYEKGLLFVTECNVNNVRTVEGRSQDPRTDSAIAGAWLASYLVTVGPIVDVVLVSRLAGDTWGMVHSDGSGGPLYWTARLFREHFPRGGQLVGATSTARTRLLALGAVYETHKSLLLINRANQPAVVGLDCSGFAGPVRATLVGAGGTEPGLSTLELPVELETRQVQPPTPEGATEPPPPTKETRAKCSGVTLPPYGVAVVEFRGAR